MTKEEFSQLKAGDILENKKTKARYVLIPSVSTLEPITQVKKEHIATRIEEFNILIRRLPNE